MNDVTTITFGLQAFVTLLVILDPPGATPVFLGVLGNRSRAERTLLAWQAAATSLFVITLFALFGQFIVGYLDISMPALQGAGGLLLLLVSLELLKGNDHKDDEGAKKNLALVPLGTPLLAGPGAIVTIMLFAQEVESTSMTLALALAVVGAHLIIGLTLMFSTHVVSLIKESGVMLLAKVAGLLTAAIAFEMLMTGIKELFSV
ncbi:MAG: MarC family protein [Candidatus Nanopelagicaceae bacterium]|nr:MarC family protein [Candidatus Nanopelagicaceae bacterium]